MQNHQIINIILLVFGVIILLREIYRIKKQDRIRPFQLLASILLMGLAIYALINNMSIEALKLKIEGMFKK